MEITLNDEQSSALGQLIAQGSIARLQGGWFVPACLDEFLFLVSDSWLHALIAYIDETYSGAIPNQPEYCDWMRLKKAIEIELARRVDSARKLDER